MASLDMFPDDFIKELIRDANRQALGYEEAIRAAVQHLIDEWGEEEFVRRLKATSLFASNDREYDI